MAPSVPRNRRARCLRALGASAVVLALTGPTVSCTSTTASDGVVALTGSTVPPPTRPPASGSAIAGRKVDEEAGVAAEPLATAVVDGAIDGAAPRPEWLGRRTLPTTPDGRVEVPQTTPEALRDRRLATVDLLEPPTGGEFAASIGPVEPVVLARSTWVQGCPVEPEDLAYLRLTFWGFDERPHTGEMIVHRGVAADVVSVFERLYQTRFPIEEMRVVSPEDLAAPPTGDGNNTTSFVCRAVTGGTAFSEHASGLAIDVNPFHNPYRRGDLILPELAGHYLDRSADRPGLIRDGDAAVQAFEAIGWTWGGHWESLRDYQHFSLSGR